MLNDKEIIVYETIYEFINKNGYSPTIRELCNVLNYKSTKTTYYYLKRLKEKNYINFKELKKRSIVINKKITKKVLVINTQKIINIDIGDNHIIYQIKNNYFEHYFIKKNDYLIINTKRKIKNDDLGLFLINKKYQIMKYNYYDGYYILEDNNQEILNKIDLIGVVEHIYRDKI